MHPDKKWKLTGAQCVSTLWSPPTPSVIKFVVEISTFRHHSVVFYSIFMYVQKAKDSVPVPAIHANSKSYEIIAIIELLFWPNEKWLDSFSTDFDYSLDMCPVITRKSSRIYRHLPHEWRSALHIGCVACNGSNASTRKNCGKKREKKMGNRLLSLLCVYTLEKFIVNEALHKIQFPSICSIHS